MTDNKVLLSNIRRIRESKNIKQEYVAEQLGISPATYSKIENGKVKLSAERLQQIANALSVPLTKLTHNGHNHETDHQVADQHNQELADAQKQVVDLLQERAVSAEREKRLLAYIRVLEKKNVD